MDARWMLFATIALMAGSGCFSKTHIYSRPAGADVVLDQKRALGKTPIELDEQVWLWTKHSITVAADGYAPQTIQIRATGINYGYAVICVCTLGLLFPIALLSEYPDQYVVELTSQTPAPEQAMLIANESVTFR